MPVVSPTQGRRVPFAIRLLEGAHGQEHEQEVKVEEAEVMTSYHLVRRFCLDELRASCLRLLARRKRRDLSVLLANICVCFFWSIDS